MTDISINQVAAVAQACHEANRAFCQGTGDLSQPTWRDAPEWQRSSAVAGVAAVLRGDTPEQLHESWSAVKIADGWVYGDVKDPDAKTHPCLVPYNDLPLVQKAKDHIFSDVANALISAFETGNYQAVLDAHKS